jgi:nucleotide-binding universal stress UspA family protein
MERLKNVLVGVDGSAASGAALREAVRIARADGATVHVVHVLDATVVDDLKEALGTGGEVDRALADRARHVTDRLLQESEPGDLKTDVRVEIGNAVDALLRRGRDVPADAIVLGAGGGQDGIGPNALKVVRDARTPVLVVREGHRGPWRRVVACVDFSDTSRIVLEEAARIAKADGASLHALHVFAPPWDVLRYEAPAADAGAGYRERYLATQQRYMEGLVAPLVAASPGLPVETLVVEGMRPADGVTDFVRARKADLVVVGTRGRSKLAYLLLGTTAARILRSVPVSVLAVRSPGAAEPRTAAVPSRA